MFISRTSYPGRVQPVVSYGADGEPSSVYMMPLDASSVAPAAQASNSRDSTAGIYVQVGTPAAPMAVTCPPSILAFGDWAAAGAGTIYDNGWTYSAWEDTLVDQYWADPYYRTISKTPTQNMSLATFLDEVAFGCTQIRVTNANGYEMEMFVNTYAEGGLSISTIQSGVGYNIPTLPFDIFYLKPASSWVNGQNTIVTKIEVK